MQAIQITLELWAIEDVWRADQPAIQRIGPGVIAALDRAVQMARRLGAESRATVATDVEERAQVALLGAHDDNAFIGDGERAVVAGLGEAVRDPAVDPHPREDALLFARRWRDRSSNVLGMSLEMEIVRRRQCL